MNRKFTMTLLMFTAVALPVAVFAAEAEGGHTGRQLYDLAMRIINFLILVGALIYFTRKPLRSFIENSIESIRKLLKDAESTKSEAEAKMKEAEEKLKGLSREVDQIMAQARSESQAEKARITEEAEAAAVKLREEATRSIQQELKKSQETLRNEAAQIALELAREIIRENITEADHKRFVAEYLEKLEATKQ